MRLRFMLGICVCVLGLLPLNAAAAPLLIDVVSAEYSTIVASRITGLNGAPLTEPILTSVPTTSGAPLTSTLSHGGSVWSTASVGDFFVDAATDADLAAIAGNGNAYATAILELTFAPVLTGIGTIGLDFIGTGQAQHSNGLFALVDLTASQMLWSYGWANSGDFMAQIRWTCCTDQAFTASLSTSSAFDASHLYQLTMSVGTNSSAGDAEGVRVRASGLEDVPEPASLLLLSTAASAVYLQRRRQRRHAPVGAGA